MTKRFLMLLIASSLLILLGAAQGGKEYNAARFDVDVTAEHDGSLTVQETVTFNFIGGPFSFVFRELPTDHTDGIMSIAAGVDGSQWPEGTEAGQIEISGRDPLRITWHLPPTSNATQTFELNYQVLGVVRQAEEADVLIWQALPDEYDYTIDSSRITFTFPDDAELIGTPEVTAGSADVTVEGNQVIATMQNLDEDDPLVMELRFTPGTLISTPPAWQSRQAEQQAQHSRYAWIWIALATVIGLGGITWIVSQARSSSKAAPKVSGVRYEPPADLPPAIAGMLQLPNGRAGWPQALGTLFDLAERGILIIEEQPKEAWYQSRDWVIKQVEPGRHLRPHEEQLLEILFTTKSGEPQNSIKMSKLSQLFTSSRWKAYTETLEAEMKAAGLWDTEQQERNRRLIGAGVVAILFAAGMFLVAMLLNGVFGFWPLLVVGVLFVLFLIAIIAGYSLSVLSTEGTRQAAEWEPFQRYLKDITKRKATPSSPDMFERYLPFAAAYGLLTDWVKHFEKEERTQPPTYFRALHAADGAHMSAFVAMISASSSAGGSAAGAGAAGAGAAGGGASGAG